MNGVYSSFTLFIIDPTATAVAVASATAFQTNWPLSVSSLLSPLAQLSAAPYCSWNSALFTLTVSAFEH